MVSSGVLRRVALVRTNVPEELSAFMVFLRSVRRLLVTASVVPSSPILDTLIKEALSSSETSIVTRATRRNIPGDAILHSHRRKNLKSYMDQSHPLTSEAKNDETISQLPHVSSWYWALLSTGTTLTVLSNRADKL
jgi:hypothetical protein